MNADERRLIVYAAFSHALVHIIELTYPALLSRIGEDFELRDVILGAIASVFAWAFGGSAIPAGFLTERLGSRRVLLYAFVGATVALVLVGISSNGWFLGVGLALLGLCIGLYHPGGLSLMAQGVRKRGLALGWHGVAGNVGQALAPAIAVGLAVAVDWRLAFFVLAGAAAVMAVVLSVTTLPLLGGSEVLSTASESAPAAEAQPRQRGGHRLMGSLILVYAGLVLSGIVYRGAITFLPRHLEELVNDDLGGAFATVALLIGAVGQLVGGALSQRVRLERLVPVLAALALPALVFTGIVGGALLVVIASVFVFFYFANQPVFTGLIADYAPPGAVGRSYGFSFFAAFGLGGTGGIIAGAFVDRWDTQAAFLGMAAFMAVTVLLGIVIWMMSERRSPSVELETASG